MIVTYLRSSSMGTWKMCEMQYYINYCLGINSPPNRKALMGTVVHKVMEILAQKKKCIQDRVYEFHDDALGTFDSNLYKPYINDLVEMACQYYEPQLDKPLAGWERAKCRNWAWECLKYRDGLYDPRKANIISPEKRFDITINEPWAAYEYEHDGQVINGQLAIKGTIDLITEESPGVLESVDYKGLHVETPILTSSGFKTIKDIGIGEIVYDQYDKPTTVVGVSDITHKDSYEIEFINLVNNSKHTIIADIDHYWPLGSGNPIQTVCLKPNMLIGYDSSFMVNTVFQIGKQYTKCISVNSEDHTYLCGKGFVPTHNTGLRKDWATGKQKDYWKLCSDNQLLLYNYAMAQLYPKYHTIMSTIYFIQDGGPYTIVFEKKDQERFSKRLRGIFDRIKNTNVPKIVYPSFKCNFCHYFKTCADGTPNSTKDYENSLCHSILKSVKKKGIDETTKEYGTGQFDYYSPPG